MTRSTGPLHLSSLSAGEVHWHILETLVFLYPLLGIGSACFLEVWCMLLRRCPTALSWRSRCCRDNCGHPQNTSAACFPPHQPNKWLWVTDWGNDLHTGKAAEPPSAAVTIPRSPPWPSAHKLRGHSCGWGHHGVSMQSFEQAQAGRCLLLLLLHSRWA